MIDLVTIEYGHRKEETQVFFIEQKGLLQLKIADYWSLLGLGRNK